LLTNVAVSIAEYLQNRLQSCAECHIDKNSAALLKKSSENKWRGQKFVDQIFSKFLKQEAPKTSFKNFLAQRMNFHQTGRKNLSGVGTLEDAAAGAG
jgi:hypothetical protein